MSLLLQAQLWISPWWLLKRPSNLPQMTFSAISWATMGERPCLECNTLLCSSTFGFLIPTRLWPAADWQSSGRCWLVAVQECAKLSLPHPWRCSRSSCRMLADLVIRKKMIQNIFKNTWGFLPLEITTRCLCYQAAQQRVLPSVITTLKMGGTSTVLSRSYNTSPASKSVRVSATQITRELLRTKGVRALYRGLGATLMRSEKIPFLIFGSILFCQPSPNMVTTFADLSGTSHSPLCISLFSHIFTSSAGARPETQRCRFIGRLCLDAWLDVLQRLLSALAMVSHIFCFPSWLCTFWFMTF